MKYLALTLVILAITMEIIAQDVAFSNKLIRKYQMGKNQLKSATIIPHDYLWLTPLLLEVKLNWNKLTDEAKNLFKTIAERPKFIGTENVATYENFVFHYSVNGPKEESVDPEDLDKSGIPDYVERMAFIFGDSIHSLYHHTTKLSIPPHDADHVNGAYYDVYIGGDKADVLGFGTYGYVSPENTIGDNPNSLQLKETKSTTSFMVMRNNYNGYDKSEIISISVTAAHEYMHAIQFGYSVDMDSWFMEGASTWAEEFAFPGYDDNFQYLSSVFSKPDVALNYENSEDPENTLNDGHWYGNWLYVKHLTEHTSNDIIKNIYERCIYENAIHSIDQVLKEIWNSDFETMFLQYIIANSLLGIEHEFTPFTYKRASDYLKKIENDKLSKFEGTLTFNGQQINFNSQTEGNDTLMRLSYENFYLESSKNFDVEFTPSNSTDKVDVLLIKCSSEQGPAIQIPTYLGNTSIIEVNDNSKWDYYKCVIWRLDMDVKNIAPTNYILVIKPETLTSNLEKFKFDPEVYPNPADEQIHINISENDLKWIRVELFDLAGRKVLSKQITNNTMLDVSNLLAGIYVLKISDERGEIVKTKQIIK